MSNSMGDLVHTFCDLDELIFTLVAEGVYSDSEREKLHHAYDVAKKNGVNVDDILKLGGISKAVIGGFLAGGKPKLNNFILLVGDLRTVVGEVLCRAGALESVSLEVKGTAWVRTYRYTNSGNIDKLILALEDFRSEFVALNYFDDEINKEKKEELIEVLEKILNQLKNGSVEMNTIRYLGRKVGDIVKWSSEKLAGKALGKLGEIAVEKLMGL